MKGYEIMTETKKTTHPEHFVASIQNAAWLQLAGFELLRITQKGKHKNFHFPNSEDLQKYIAMFRSGEYFSDEFRDAVSKLRAMPTIQRQ